MLDTPNVLPDFFHIDFFFSSSNVELWRLILHKTLLYKSAY